VVCPTVREADGLAVSSRNKYLSERERKDAAMIYRSLEECRRMTEGGVRDADEIVDRMREILREAPSIEVEYVSIVDAETLQKMDRITGTILAAVAARLGGTRLIDNILVDCEA
jgi:pantoate--beta-alanine ligase